MTVSSPLISEDDSAVVADAMSVRADSVVGIEQEKPVTVNSAKTMATSDDTIKGGMSVKEGLEDSEVEAAREKSKKKKKGKKKGTAQSQSTA